MVHIHLNSKPRVPFKGVSLGCDYKRMCHLDVTISDDGLNKMKIEKSSTKLGSYATNSQIRLNVCSISFQQWLKEEKKL